MKFTKPHFIASVSSDAQEQKKLLISKYGDFDENDSDIFIVLGLSLIHISEPTRPY